jgi:hypothetical protein
MTPRRLAVLINGLPPDSATRYAMEHPDDVADRRWTDLEFLLAHQVNVQHQQLRVSWVGGRLKGKAPVLPDIVPPDDLVAHEQELARKRERRDKQLTYLRQYKTGVKAARQAPGYLKPKPRDLELARDTARPATPLTPELEARIREAARR